MGKIAFLFLFSVLILSGCFAGNYGNVPINDHEEASMPDEEITENLLAGADRSCFQDEDCATRRVNCGDCGYEFACVNKNVESCFLDPLKRENCPPVPNAWFSNCKCIEGSCIECREDDCGNPFFAE